MEHDVPGHKFELKEEKVMSRVQLVQVEDANGKAREIFEDIQPLSRALKL